MKNLLYLILAFVVLSVNESFSEDYTWPFNDCYQAEFDTCSQGCTDSLMLTKNFMYAGCPIEVSYKVRVCQCPQPTAFIYITYIRINISSPPACCDLICQLYPPGPFVQNCDPGQQELNCFNNPGDEVAMFNLSEYLYSMIGDTVFSEVSDNYICPNELTVKYYWPSECFNFCTYNIREIQPSNPMDPLTARIIVPTACDTTGCCGTTFTYCKDSQGNIIKNTTAQIGPIPCFPLVTPQCLDVNTIIGFNGVGYTITSVSSTGCIAPCSYGSED